MADKFEDMLKVGGKSNSLGRVNEVIDLVINDRSRLDELYGCITNEDAWVRMRAIDALEKICRQHPDWLLPFIDKFRDELTIIDQASVRWHLAQIYGQINLSDA